MNKFKGVLHAIIHPDQKQCVPTRYTGENIFEITYINDY